MLAPGLSQHWRWDPKSGRWRGRAPADGVGEDGSLAAGHTPLTSAVFLGPFPSSLDTHPP